jgi:hypothetical protein
MKLVKPQGSLEEEKILLALPGVKSRFLFFPVHDMFITVITLSGLLEV